MSEIKNDRLDMYEAVWQGVIIWGVGL